VRTTENSPLRRQARGLTEKQALEILQKTDHAVLSTADEAGVPYGVPVSPVWIGGSIYFHATGLPGGRKEENMRMNRKVSLCFIGKAVTLPEWYSVDFASVVVQGTATKVEDEKEKQMVMDALLRRHAPKNSAVRNAVQIKVRGPYAAVWKVTVEKLTGKARAAKVWRGEDSLKEVEELEPSPWLMGVPY
jgi:hypothetical protein